MMLTKHSRTGRRRNKKKRIGAFLVRPPPPPTTTIIQQQRQRQRGRYSPISSSSSAAVTLLLAAGSSPPGVRSIAKALPSSTTATSCNSNTIRAACILLVSSILGCRCGDDYDIGIIVSMIISSLASNLGIVPNQHKLYDTCWTIVPPISLALLLLSIKTTTTTLISITRTHDNNHDNNDHQVTTKTTTTKTSPPPPPPSFGKNVFATGTALSPLPPTTPTTLSAIIRLTIPFLVASIGSIMGCVLAFLMCYKFYSPASSFSSSIKWSKLSSFLLLSPSDAIIAASCLTASFIGGSVNFFSTATAIRNIITTSMSTSASTRTLSTNSNSSNNNRLSSLISAMSSADVVIMAIYFAGLASALQSKRLQMWFDKTPPQKQGSRNLQDGAVVAKDVLKQQDQQGGPSTPSSQEQQQQESSSLLKENELQAAATLSSSTSSSSSPPASSSPITMSLLLSPQKRIVQATIVAFVMSYMLAMIALRVERILNRWIPGTACAILAIAVPALNQQIATALVHQQRHYNCFKLRQWLHSFWMDIQNVSEPLSKFAFMHLFATMGVTANIRSAILTAGPASIVFCSTALLVHIITTIFISRWILLLSSSLSNQKRSKQRRRGEEEEEGRAKMITTNISSPASTLLSYSFSDVLVASNAAIGGASTAAAFCGQVVVVAPAGDDSSNDEVPQQPPSSSISSSSTPQSYSSSFSKPGDHAAATTITETNREVVYNEKENNNNETDDNSTPTINNNNAKSSSSEYSSSSSMKRIQMKRTLTVSATIWAVVGYAIGTTVGVTLYRILIAVTRTKINL